MSVMCTHCDEYSIPDPPALSGDILDVHQTSMSWLFEAHDKAAWLTSEDNLTPALAAQFWASVAQEAACAAAIMVRAATRV